MMQTPYLLSLACSLLCVLTVSFASIGQVDLQQVNQRSSFVRDKNQVLIASQRKRQDQVSALEQTLRKFSLRKRQEIAQIKNQHQKDEALKTAQIQVALKEQALRKKVAQLQQQQLKEQQQAQKLIDDRLNQQLKTLMQKDKVSVLIRKQAILYANQKIPDLTTALIVALK